MKDKNKKQEDMEDLAEEILNELVDDMLTENGDAEEFAEDLDANGEELSEMDTLKLQLAEAQAESAKNLDNWQRMQAEFQNFRSRQERERQQNHELAVGRVVKGYLDVVDDLERALGNQPDDAEVTEWAQGIELTYRKILTLLESEGVKPMEALGAEFDPMLHEAIMQEDSDAYESGQVTEVLRQGYIIGERVVRPALVKVAS